MFDYSTIDQECFANAKENTVTAKHVLQKCRHRFANEMQHGRKTFHLHVASRLDSIIRAVSFKHTHSFQTRLNTSTSCYGAWGVPTVKKHLGLIASANKGFIYSAIWRPDKVSFHSNTVNSSITFTCPTTYGRIGYVAHSNRKESVQYIVNRVQMTSHRENHVKNVNFRTEEYTSLTSSPMVVTVLAVAAKKAHLEITTVVCTNVDEQGSDT